MKAKHVINYTKLFGDLMKDAMKSLEDYRTPKYSYNFDANLGVYTVTEGHFAVFFNKIMNVINFDNDTCFRWCELSAKTFDEKIGQCELVKVTDTRTTRKLISGVNCRILTAGEREIYIDEKLLAYFNLDASLGCEIKTPDKAYTPIYIYEFGTLVGLVMPIMNAK